MCLKCDDAISWDQVAIVVVGGDAEVAVVACDEHLRRMVLALDVLDAVEQLEQFVIPPLVDAAFLDRVKVNPGRRS